MTDKEWGRVNRAFGSVMGAFVGDSLGSYLEFQRKITEEMLEKALKMEGGGKLWTGPG